MRRPIVHLIALIVCAKVLAACTSDDASSGRIAVTDGGAGDATSSTFGASACSTCVEQQCASELATCGDEPECGRAWSCVRGCPVTESGEPEPSCAEACRIDGASYVAFSSCSGAAACAECGRSAVDGGGSDAGAGDPGGHPLLEQICEPSTTEDACERCEDDRCCESQAACRADPACDAFRICVQACPDPYLECLESCDVEAPGGYLPFTARLACLSVFCAVDCGASPGACEQCLYGNCAAPYAKCRISEPCARQGDCFARCSTQACRDACMAEFPEGTDDLLAVGVCTQNACADVCAE